MGGELWIQVKEKGRLKAFRAECNEYFHGFDLDQVWSILHALELLSSTVHVAAWQDAGNNLHASKMGQHRIEKHGMEVHQDDWLIMVARQQYSNVLSVQPKSIIFN